MNNEYLIKKILYLRKVEKLSFRQIGKELGICRNRASRVLRQQDIPIKPLHRPWIIEPYKELISVWYRDRPYLKALQVYERLLSYGFTGSYPTVAGYTSKYRRKRQEAYHTLHFLPGQEAQIDWFYFNHETIGKVYGFLYVLCYSRYAWGKFYPRNSFEFFLDAHIECFEHLKGLAHTHRYDNLKSVVLKRYPSIEYNAQFLDFARHYGFSIYVCNPYSGNEKGRVERPIRDIRSFLYAEDFEDIKELNCKYHRWLDKRNNKIHRSTQKTPKELLSQENLLKLPLNSYPPTRTIPGVSISKTCLVEFETNKYSVPSPWTQKPAEIVAYPEKIEIWTQGNRIATHKRCFNKRQIVRNPLHAEKLLNKTSHHFKLQRIYQLISSMNPAFKFFLFNQEDDRHRIQSAYELFRLLKSHSKPMLISAVTQLNTMRSFKLKALLSLLKLPVPYQPERVWPKSIELLNLNYKERSLNDYDTLT